MSTFGSVVQARLAGFEVCRVDEDGFLVRRFGHGGAVRFGWVPRPARFVRGIAHRETPATAAVAVQAKSASFWFPF